MNASTQARARAATHTPPGGPVLIWDLPVRLFHWLMVVCFAGAWLTAESEALHLIHITLGYTLGGLVVFRLVWGLVGSRTARFSSFVRGPGAALAYLRSLRSSAPEHHAGHNPAGALAIVALLGLGLATVLLGWATEMEWLPPALDEAHELAANALMGVVLLHLLGVAVGSWRHRENLPRAMLTGRKAAPADQAIAGSRWPVAALLLAAVLGFWAWQWQAAPAGSGPAAWAALLAGESEQEEEGDETLAPAAPANQADKAAEAAEATQPAQPAPRTKTLEASPP